MYNSALPQQYGAAGRPYWLCIPVYTRLFDVSWRSERATTRPFCVLVYTFDLYAAHHVALFYSYVQHNIPCRLGGERKDHLRCLILLAALN